ncbi:LEA type 2 family protein [Paraflavisolibacter sp. H34]|uniref:LEA type 2 family protein n=1 Tax=Huijunlia imazamoxiresistens TaxID=3127457 RepID=UPI00301878C1
MSQTDIGFSVTYYNPNNFGVTVKEAAADFYIDSTFVGKFTQDQDVAVGKKEEFSISFTGAIPLMTLMSLNINDLANREVPIRAVGLVKVGKGGVFLTRPFTYQGKHRLDVRL